MEKAYFRGTHRCLEPGQTLEAVSPLFGEYGITRLADVTGLDTLGVPVVMAVRPLASTISTGQGKGATFEAAAVSAVMEAIELWHAEAAVPAVSCHAPATELGLDGQVAGLNLPGSIATSGTVLDWIDARTVSGAPAMVPRDLVLMGPRNPGEWSCLSAGASTNGLASGNTRDEAVAHALHEIAERDAIAALKTAPSAAQGTVTVDLASAPDYCAEMASRIRGGGGDLHVIAVPSRFGIPCFVAYLRAGDAPWTATGAGAHSDPAVALSRAVTEACQSRLTIISGTRDDLAPGLYRGLPDQAPPFKAGDAAQWAMVTAGLGWTAATDQDEAARAALSITTVTGIEPRVVDLAQRPELAVVKVLAPGTRFAPTHSTPLPGGAAP